MQMWDVQPTIKNRIEIGHENKGVFEHPGKIPKPDFYYYYYYYWNNLPEEVIITKSSKSLPNHLPHRNLAD